MHPDIMRELARQRRDERVEAARKASLAKALRKAIREQRTRSQAPDTFVVPAIPDYVDGTFHVPEDAVPTQRADKAPVAKSGKASRTAHARTALPSRAASQPLHPQTPTGMPVRYRRTGHCYQAGTQVAVVHPARFAVSSASYLRRQS